MPRGGLLLLCHRGSSRLRSACTSLACAPQAPYGPARGSLFASVGEIHHSVPPCGGTVGCSVCAGARGDRSGVEGPTARRHRAARAKQRCAEPTADAGEGAAERSRPLIVGLCLHPSGQPSQPTPLHHSIHPKHSIDDLPLCSHLRPSLASLPLSLAPTTTTQWRRRTPRRPSTPRPACRRASCPSPSPRRPSPRRPRRPRTARPPATR